MASSIFSKSILFFSLFIFGLTSAVSFAALFPNHSINTPVKGSDPGPSIQDLGRHAGYYNLTRTKASRMFYIFFESRENKSDPVVIYLNGGPGCSGQQSLFYENGPFKITENFSLVWNDNGWDKVSNLLFVDQPIGTGFSYAIDKTDIPQDEEGVSQDLYDFIQAFFKEYPQYAMNDFYITGGSYAGHYVPAFAARVQQGNKAKEGIHINLKGIAIGNPLTNSVVQYNSMPEYALDKKLIKPSDYIPVGRTVSWCTESGIACDSKGGQACIKSFIICNYIFNQITGIAGDLNYLDIRMKCVGDACYDNSRAVAFLNKKEVKDALGVGDRDFAICNIAVRSALMMDWMKNLDVGIPALLEAGIKVLVYVGEYDLLCNWIGNLRWVRALEWSGQKEFVAAANVSFSVDGADAGQLTSHGPLTFLKVYNAAHFVALDQPKVALQMITRWLQGNLN